MMTETAGLSAGEAAAAARAAEQARIRKERREAKIKAGGSARLNKITGLGGGIQRGKYSPVIYTFPRRQHILISHVTDPIPSNPPATSTSTSASPASTPAVHPQPQSSAAEQHGDPEEVDISQHYYEPNNTNRVPPPEVSGNVSQDQLRQIMLGLDRPQTPNGAGMPPNPFFDPSLFGGMMDVNGGGADGAEDPMMKMLSQMMGGAGAGAGGPGNNPFAGMQQQQQQATAIPDSYAAMWRVLHFILALGLGLYIAVFTGFLGTKVERERGAFAATTAADTEDVLAMRKYFFWTFATAETVLLTSRFFLDRGRASPPGMLWTIMGFLPQSTWKGYLATGLRYSQIFSTVRSDILTCVFVLGVCSYLRS